MEIKVTKKQNVKVDGVKFKAVPTGVLSGCSLCAFDSEMGEACAVAPCQDHSRADGRDVVFVRKA